MAGETLAPLPAQALIGEPIQGLAAIVADPKLPKLYCQAFGAFSSPVDVTLVLINCNAPTGLISLNFSTAKGLAAVLTDLVKKYEDAIGGTVLTPEEAHHKVQPSAKPSS
jgi:hypothetical protein